MSAGNLTNGTLSLNALYVDGVSITGPAGAGVNSLNGNIGEVVIADDGNDSMVVGTTGVDAGNAVTVDTTLATGIAPMTSSSATTTIAVPGLSNTSIILCSIHAPDSGLSGNFIKSATATTDTITVVLNATSGASNTGSFQWTVLQF